MRKILLLFCASLLLAAPARAQVSGPPNVFTSGSVANPDDVNLNFATIYSAALNRTGGTMSGTLNTVAVLPVTTNTYDIGSSSDFLRTLYAQTSLVLGQTTANYTLTWANPSGARAITINDPGGSDAFAFLAATQTLTNKTLTAPVFSGSVTGTYTLAGTPTISAPVLSGTVTGTYTLGGTPTIAQSAISGLIALSKGGTNADLSATGGTSRFLKQASSGAAVTVVQPAVADLSDGANVVVTTGSFADPSWITSLAPSKLATGTVGSGVTWHGVAVGTQFGGTGQNFSAVAAESIPYFSATGVMSTVAPSTTGMMLQTQGVGNPPAWSFDGSNIQSMSATNITSGTLPTGRLSGTYSSALTLSSTSNVIAGTFTGVHNSSDGSAGATVAACNATGGPLVFKNGLLISGC